MSEELHIIDYLDPVRALSLLKNDGYKDGQIGKQITVYEEGFPDLLQAEIVLIGCEEQRGAGRNRNLLHAPDAIREQFYQLFSWQGDIKIVDAGNIKSGATLADTYAALKMVLIELMDMAGAVVILGGSHDLTLAQYNSYGGKKKVIEATCVDAL